MQCPLTKVRKCANAVSDEKHSSKRTMLRKILWIKFSPRNSRQNEKLENISWTQKACMVSWNQAAIRHTHTFSFFLSHSYTNVTLSLFQPLNARAWFRCQATSKASSNTRKTYFLSSLLKNFSLSLSLSQTISQNPSLSHTRYLSHSTFLTF